MTAVWIVVAFVLAFSLGYFAGADSRRTRRHVACLKRIAELCDGYVDEERFIEHPIATAWLSQIRGIVDDAEIPGLPFGFFNARIDERRQRSTR